MAIDFSKYGTPLNQKPTGVSGQQTTTTRTPMVTKLPEKEEKFFGMTGQEFLAQPKYKQYAEAFIATLPKDAADFFSGVLNLGKSAVEAVPTIATAGQYTPDLGGYVSEAKKAAEQNKGLVKSLVIPSAKTVISGLETLGTVKTLEKLTAAYGKLNLTNKSLSQTSSSLSKAERTSAGARELKGSTLVGGVKKVPTSYEKEVAKAAEPYISNNIVKTEKNIKNGVSKIASELSNNIEKSSKVLNTKLQKKLFDEIDNISPTIFTKADPVKNAAFNEFKSKVLTTIGTAKNDAELFNARKLLDNIVNVETQGKIWDVGGRYNPIYEFWRQGRKAINNVVSNRIPGTAESLKKQSLLYDALEGVAEKTGKLLGQPSKIGQLGTSIKRGVGYTIVGSGTGAAVGAILANK